jgi:hypothetical protein
MKIYKPLLLGVCVVSLGGLAMPVTASAEVGIYLNIGPPPLRHEVVPSPRHGYVWSPGYWNARHNRHTWQAGHWERERAGYRFSQPGWTQRDNRWQLERGHWDRNDRDGDGVPNHVDRAPGNTDRH